MPVWGLAGLMAGALVAAQAVMGLAAWYVRGHPTPVDGFDFNKPAVALAAGLLALAVQAATLAVYRELLA